MKKKIILILLVFIQIPTFSQKTGTFTDPRDSKTYKTVIIGNQVWIAENLAFRTDSGCWAYKNNQSNVIKYGYLYNWETAKKICPTAWHLPSKEEFENLLYNCGEDPEIAYKALLPGGSSGFWALFSGIRGSSFGFYYIGIDTYFWSSTSHDVADAWNLYIYSANSKVGLYNLYRSCGFSVRCIRD
jgi:uncharacterized protein (TIGR02145 family)